MTFTGLKPPKGEAKHVEAVYQPKGKARMKTNHLPSTEQIPPKGKSKQVESFYMPKEKAGTTSNHLPTDKYHVICYMRHHYKTFEYIRQELAYRHRRLEKEKPYLWPQEELKMEEVCRRANCQQTNIMKSAI